MNKLFKQGYKLKFISHDGIEIILNSDKEFYTFINKEFGLDADYIEYFRLLFSRYYRIYDARDKFYIGKLRRLKGDR